MHNLLKLLLAALGISLVLALAIMAVSAIWSLKLISWPMFWRIWISCLIGVIVCYALWTLIRTMFAHDRYDESKGNKAHPMI